MNLKKLFKSFTQITVNTIDIKFIKEELAIIERLLNRLKGGEVEQIVENSISDKLSTKQDVLVSGQNLKTVNNNSLLGNGNVDINGALIVNFTDGNDDTLVADKTFNEVQAAVMSGNVVLGKYSHNIYLVTDHYIDNSVSFITAFNNGNGIIPIRIISLWNDNKAYIDSFNLNDSGNSSNRPYSNLPIGYFYFDTDLNQPIWWNGEDWVDALGNTPESVNYVYTTSPGLI